MFFVHLIYGGAHVAGCWGELTLEGRIEIEKQLATHMSRLRSVPKPEPSFLGSLATVVCRDARRTQRQGHEITSEGQFNDFIGRFTVRRESEFAKILLSLLKDNHRVVLTHGDFTPRNILIKDGKVTGIIDWELGLNIGNLSRGIPMEKVWKGGGVI